MAYTTCYSQSIVKFVNSKNNEPIRGIYAKVILNQNTFLSNGMSDKNGYFKTKFTDSNLNSNYKVVVNMLRYNYISKELDLKNKDTLVVKIKENKYFLKNSQNYFSSECGSIVFFKYEPKIIRSLNDLPNPISKKVKLYLKKRVGNNVFKSFNLINGQIVDLEELKKRNPESEYETAYYLCFSYRNLKAGISMYSSTLKLDRNGNILKDIDFPILKKNTFKKIIPFSEIKKKAIEKDFLKDRTAIDIGYLPEENLLVWKFVNEQYINNHQISREEIIFNIRDGQYLRTNIKLID